MRSRAGLTAALLAAAAVATACSEIPTSGPVLGAGAPQAEDQGSYVEVTEVAPQAGMTQEQIVDGFIAAMGSYQPGYGIARQYLTDEAAAQWDPSAGVTVFYEPKPPTELVNENTVNVRMTVHGQVDSDGTFTENSPVGQGDFDLLLEQVDGEWRIANPDPGILIADFNFDREFQPRNVYFFDPGFEVLVPDVVYLPLTANDATATLLARKVLGGPTALLEPAVATAFPDGAQLALDSVPVNNSVATVELSPETVPDGQEERERMAAQLTWTLGVLAEIERVEVLVSKVPLVPGRPLSPHDPLMRGYDPAVLAPDTPLYAITETGVASVVEGELAQVAGPLGELADVDELAVNIARNRAAVISGGGTQLMVGAFSDEEPIEPIRAGVNLVSPSWDRTDLIWAVDHGVEGHGVVVTRPDGQVVAVDAPELDGLDVDRLAVSPDGTRIALIAGGRAQVADIIRDGDATIRIGTPMPIGPEGTVLDVAWSAFSPSASAGDTVVILLETEQEGVRGVQPYFAALSGQETLPRGLPAEPAAHVAAMPGLQAVLATDDGLLFVQRSNNTWTEIGAARNPTYPG